VRLRYRPKGEDVGERFGSAFDDVFAARIAESNAYYDALLPTNLKADERSLMRQAAGGLLWTKQFYHYVVEEWLTGDPAMPVPPPSRRRIRNADWGHLFNRDVISMPDKWEYPWYAAWDLAFHMLPMAKLDPDFAKRQLGIFLREWYMHPNGQIPAYEFELSDVNPPVHAWAVLQVFLQERECGREDYSFLAGAFQKLLMNFTWWVNRKDAFGEHLFSGGFLGLDNIGVFDRSKPLPTGGTLEQADGTAWMGFYCVIMLRIAFRLALVQREYADTASKFFEHFIHIADAINHLGGTGLWDERDGFYYDRMRVGDQSTVLRVRSIAGLMPLCSAMILSQETVEKLPGFRRRMNWFLKYRQDLSRDMSYLETEEETDRPTDRLLALPSKERLRRALKYVFDENEFLSPFGIRSLSKYHAANPYVFHVDGAEYRVGYEPAESQSGMFGGNSNWRGPIWFPLNYLLIESLRTYDAFYQEKFRIEYPTGSGEERCLREIADDLEDRLLSLFEPDADGRIPYLGERPPAIDAAGEVMHEFFEYFDAETGKGLGAAHQTGWTALVINLLEARSKRRAEPREAQRVATVAHDIA
jgi:hypothetical protein